MEPRGPRKCWPRQGRRPVIEEAPLVAACAAGTASSAIGGMRPGMAAPLAGEAALAAVLHRRR